jgi:hypothetical protein
MWVSMAESNSFIKPFCEAWKRLRELTAKSIRLDPWGDVGRERLETGTRSEKKTEEDLRHLRDRGYAYGS